MTAYILYLAPTHEVAAGLCLQVVITELYNAHNNDHCKMQWSCTILW